jgi:hypothetical protein
LYHKFVFSHLKLVLSNSWWKIPFLQKRNDYGIFGNHLLQRSKYRTKLCVNLGESTTHVRQGTYVRPENMSSPVCAKNVFIEFLPITIYLLQKLVLHRRSQSDTPIICEEVVWRQHVFIENIKIIKVRIKIFLMFGESSVQSTNFWREIFTVLYIQSTHFQMD